MTNINPPQHVEYILRHLTENGHPAFLVGGCVRDALMGRHVHDWDVATSAAPVDVAVLFARTILTGEKFGTVTVVTEGDAVEVTTFRVEGEYRDSRRPESVIFVANLDEDLSRRDFTMNAMAISVAKRLVDPFGGIRDIKNRVIRCVGAPKARFAEDALRMFRAFRFRAQLGFTIEKKTLDAINANAQGAKLISAERVRVELEKTLMSQRPEIAGEMIKAGLLARYAEAPGYAPKGLERIEQLPVEPIIRWCAFCAVLQEQGFIASAMEFLHSMRLDGKTAKTCVRALSIASIPEDRKGIKRLFIEHGIEATRCAAAAHDIMSKQSEAEEPSPCFTRINEVIASGECFSLNRLAISGSDLIGMGYQPGQELGDMLNKLLNHVIDHPEDNVPRVLIDIAKKLAR